MVLHATVQVRREELAGVLLSRRQLQTLATVALAVVALALKEEHVDVQKHRWQGAVVVVRVAIVQEQREEPVDARNQQRNLG